MNFEFLLAMLVDVRYSVGIEYDEKAGEFVASMERFWFVEAGESVHRLAKQLLGLNTYFHAPI